MAAKWQSLVSLQPDQGCLFFGGVGVLPDGEPSPEKSTGFRCLDSPREAHPCFYTSTGDTSAEVGYHPDEYWPVQEDRLRQRRIWTSNKSKVQRLELDRREVQARMGLDEYIPDWSNGCSDPLHLKIFAGKNILDGASPWCQTEMLVKCGRAQCFECSSHRRRKWAARAFCEISLAQRTWFVTMTAKPETMAKWCLAAAIEFSPFIGRTLLSHQYDAIVKAAYRDIQLWKKRLAKGRRGLRFLVTVERHTGKRTETERGKVSRGDYVGLPHFHMFVHETEDRVSWRVLKKQTTELGLSEMKLVDKSDAKAAWYICKYLSKDNGTRNVWPSFRYGRPTNGRLPVALDEIAMGDLDTNFPE